MARKVGLIRYYGTSSSGSNAVEVPNTNNYPSSVTRTKLRYGTALDAAYPIILLGILTMPGVKFYVNNHTTPVIVGLTGIYELDIAGISNITDILFDNASLKLIDENPNAYLIIDYIYETEA